ncbi:MAG: putative transcriptional regulator, partial [Hyphomicrobiales bacterium]
MMRVRLKADGRLVEILADGTEAALKLPPPEADQRILAPSIAPDRPPQVDAGYARRVRSQTRLTQAE